MSISFGLQKAGSKRKPAVVIAAFEATVDDFEPELTNEQKLTESQRLQVTCVCQHCLIASAVKQHSSSQGCKQPFLCETDLVCRMREI